MNILDASRIVTFVFIFFALVSEAQRPIYQSPSFSIYPDKVVQGKYEARAISANHITSNYESQANLYQSADITFKFAINGKDNEMPSGQDHHFTVNAVNGYAETPVISFGKQLNQLTGKKSYVQPNTKLKVRLDLSEVLRQFQQNGFYTCFDGTKVYKQDFKGVYIAGNILPMTWDFDNLVNHSNLQLKDDDGDGIYETELILNAKQDQKKIESAWKQAKDVSSFPQYRSDYLLADALYNLSLEEMIKAVEPDSTFRTGKEWAGVWTRDISYSIILSMAYLQPQVAKNSLLRKVNKKKRIIQDTGTGGAYPASTDRMIWAVAAWEVYKATGDKDWLQLVFEIIKNSIEDDLKNVYDKETGLVRGESSFLDWREQTYPKWMQPADIFESECLGTNAVHYQANIVLSEMAEALNEKEIAAKHFAIAEKIKAGINKYLWMPEKGYYAQYLYGRNFKMLSPRSEALGEALCILFGIADERKAARIIASVPSTDFGITCIYPQIPNIPPYHNNAVWPFVQSYWALASAKSGNEKSVIESICNIYRPAALFLTNKENYVADNGDFAGTQINSSNMLWSLSGNLSLIHKIIFGMEFQQDKLLFHPFVPKSLIGKHALTNFKYRNAVLDIEIDGYGNKIKKFEFDGKENIKAEIPADLSGAHTIKIVLISSLPLSQKINKTINYTSPPTPVVSYSDTELSWEKIEGAVAYIIFKNGKQIIKTLNTKFHVSPGTYTEYQVIAVDKKGVQSFASEPVTISDKKQVSIYEMENYNPKSDLPYYGFSGTGFTETSKTVNTSVSIPVEIIQPGLYAIDFKYSNGNGPTNTENKCAMRTLKINKQVAGTIILPQRGTKEWSNWGFSNSVIIRLNKGAHIVTLCLEDHNDNMNGEINQAMIDYLRISKIK
jgi:Bacterial alpha-L-rhamnosidase 6 hairpin glycosidase domain